MNLVSIDEILVDQDKVVDHRARMVEGVVAGGKRDRKGDDEMIPAEGMGEVTIVDIVQCYRLRAVVHAGKVHRVAPC